MVVNDKQFRLERRVTGYVSPINKKRVMAYAKKYAVPMSRALNMILVEFFTVKK